MRNVLRIGEVVTGEGMSDEPKAPAEESPQPAPWRDPVVLLNEPIKWNRELVREVIDRVTQRALMPAPVDPLAAVTAERDALRVTIRAALAAYDAVYCDDGYGGDREAALAPLREAAK